MSSSKLSEDAQKEIEATLQHLINVAFHNGLAEAITQARALKDDYILDLFHDTLIDKFYKTLVEHHKIEELQ